MNDLLKKLGLNPTLALLISTLVIIVPLFFKIDERYAKQEELLTQVATTQDSINQLSIEVAKIAGQQAVLVAVISSELSDDEFDTPEKVNPRSTKAPASTAVPLSAIISSPKEVSTAVPKSTEEAQARLREVTKSIIASQQRLSEIGQIKK